jgi:hypothetical protein
VEVRLRASMGSTACSGAPVRRKLGLDVYKRRRPPGAPTTIKAARGPRPRLTCATGGTPRRPAVRRRSVRLVGRGARPAHSVRKGEDFKGPWGARRLGGAQHGRLGQPGARADAVRRGAARSCAARRGSRRVGVPMFDHVFPKNFE